LSFVEYSIVAVGFVLELFVAYFLLRGPIRRYPLVFAFVVFGILATACGGLVTAIGSRSTYVAVYWFIDIANHFLILWILISLIYQALNGDPRQRRLTLLFGAAVMVFAAGSLLYFHAARLGPWLTPVSRNMSLCEEMMNLVLWAILIQRRDQDYQLLLVSAGIGIKVTGEVIGHTLRMYSRSESMMWVPDLVVSLSELLWLFLWVWAFRSAEARKASALENAASSTQLS
jgi:hypothetical protein